MECQCVCLVAWDTPYGSIGLRIAEPPNQGSKRIGIDWIVPAPVEELSCEWDTRWVDDERTKCSPYDRLMYLLRLWICG
jgi:hypothetical protein